MRPLKMIDGKLQVPAMTLVEDDSNILYTLAQVERTQLVLKGKKIPQHLNASSTYFCSWLTRMDDSEVSVAAANRMLIDKGSDQLELVKERLEGILAALLSDIEQVHKTMLGMQPNVCHFAYKDNPKYSPVTHFIHEPYSAATYEALAKIIATIKSQLTGLDKSYREAFKDCQSNAELHAAVTMIIHDRAKKRTR